MDSLIPFDIFSARRAIQEMELERERLRTKLTSVNLVLTKTRADFAEVLEQLASQRAPLEYELATRQAKIISLGGQWKTSDSRWNARESSTEEDAEAYRLLYHKIANLLHCQGYFCNPDLLQEAKRAVQNHDFMNLYYVYRTALREVRQTELSAPLDKSEASDCAEKERRRLAYDLRMLRMAIQSGKEQMDGIENHPLYLAWRADMHDQYINAICDELRRAIVQLDWEIAELQAHQKNRGGLWIVH